MAKVTHRQWPLEGGWRHIVAFVVAVLAIAPRVWAAPGDLDPSFGGLATAPRASARPGDLDPSFRGTGVARTPIRRSSDATCLVQQSDGKLVAAGYSSAHRNPFELEEGSTLVRYRADGTLDRSFGRGTGMVIASGDRGQVAALVQQMDGRLVAAGFRFRGIAPQTAFAITRYSADGTLDRSFGGGTGTVTTVVGTDNAFAYALVQQSDGKLVAAGAGGGGFALVRYDADGTLDPSFGEGTGRVIGLSGQANALVQQSDGKLVAAGVSSGGGGRFTLVRYNADGSPDPSFGEGTGTVVTQFIPGLAGSDSNTGRASALVQQADGKLVAAGTSTSGLGGIIFQRRIALVRYNADGTLDPTFGAGTGIVITLVGGSTGANALVLQPDGKIVVAGGSGTSTEVLEPYTRPRPKFFTLVRYNVDGTLDQSFGRLGSGAVTEPSGFASGLVQQADGKLVAAGSRTLRHRNVFTVVRYLD